MCHLVWQYPPSVSPATVHEWYTNIKGTKAGLQAPAKCKANQRKGEKYILCKCLVGKQKLATKIKIFKVLT